MERPTIKVMFKRLRKDKSGFSLSGWAETALVVTLFILLFVGIIAEMNTKYGQNIDGTFGLNSLANTTQSQLSSYQDTIQEGANQGTSASTGTGISLSTTWSIIQGGSEIIWNFMTGGWIEQISTGLLHLNPIVGAILRIIFVLSIGFVILRLVLKLKP